MLNLEPTNNILVVCDSTYITCVLIGASVSCIQSSTGMGIAVRYELVDAIFHEVRVSVHEVRVPVHEARVSVHEARVSVHEARVSVHEARVSVHEVGVSVHEVPTVIELL